MMTSTTLVFVALPQLRILPARILILAPAPAVAAMGHLGAGMPMVVAMNSALPAWGFEIAGALSVFMALVLIRLCATVLGLVQPLRP